VAEPSLVDSVVDEVEEVVRELGLTGLQKQLAVEVFVHPDIELDPLLQVSAQAYDGAQNKAVT